MFSQPIILASQSPQRQSLFGSLAVPFESIPANLDEKAIQDTSHHKRAELVARAKAETIHRSHPEAVILAADTYLILDEKPLEKPVDTADAKRMLLLQSGRTAFELTGVCYIDEVHHLNVSQTIRVGVTFRTLSEAEIDRYVENNPVTTWSAAFCPAYPAGAALIEKIDGSFTAFTHGFPIEFFVPLLLKSGVEL